MLNFVSMMSCLAITSPQAELAVAHEKLAKESMELDGRERLGEDICSLILVQRYRRERCLRRTSSRIK